MMQALHGAYMMEMEPGSKKELLSIKGDEIIYLYSHIIADDIARFGHYARIIDTCQDRRTTNT